MRKIVACLALVTALAASQVAPVAGPEPATSSASRTVTVKDFEYAPGNLQVARGTRVVFANVSGRAHTATDKGAFDTGRIKAGRAVAVRFQQKGTFRYHCSIHPFMRGKIVVG